MLFCLALDLQLPDRRLSGVFLSDVPSDVTTHGSFFSMAHFHYTIMGGLVFTFFAAIYYWGPKMTGFQFNERLGKIHFWMMFIAFNSTFGPLFAVGFLGQPRRVVTYPAHLQFLNVWVSVSAFVLGISMLIFLDNFVYSLVFARIPAPANPWGSRSLEWQLPTPVPVHNFERIPVFDSDPYAYGEPRAPVGRACTDRREERMSDVAGSDYEIVEGEPPELLGRNLNSAAHLLASATAFFFLAFVFGYFYLRSLNNARLWRPKRVDAVAGVRGAS